MGRTIGRLATAIIVIVFAAAPLFAQSSGTFAASINKAQCLVDDGTGNLSGGITGTLLETTIKTPNASSTALLIRPSMVTGLFTKTTVTKVSPETSAVAGVKVRVTIDGNVVAPGDPAQDDGWVYYDKRFQQLSTNLFNAITDCGVDGVAADCNLTLVLSTLSAQSLDFVAPNVGGDTHKLKVEWTLEEGAGTGFEAKACVGPGVLTVEQVKTFSTGGEIVIQ